MEMAIGSVGQASDLKPTNMDIVNDNHELDTSRDSDGDATYDSSNDDRNRDEKTLPSKLTIPTENNPSSANILNLQPNLPSLRGRMIVDNGTLLCRGVWAMSDSAHDIPGQTSDFEFKLLKSLNAGTSIDSLAVDGKYTGWFMLKQAPPKPPLRIDEKDVHLHFVADADGGYSISGDGVNKFGRFSIHGSLSSVGRIQLYKAYQIKKQKGKPPGTPGRAAVPRTPTSHVAPSPRESSVRIRKPSIHIEDEPVTQQFAMPKPMKVATPRAAVMPRPAEIQRAQRASQVVIKCQDLLKELSKQMQAAYFAEPVDHVRLNIPDYPSIIDEPMDFGTIRTNLENNQYDSHEAFAEHMRLVFRNAITYNTRRDNPVHIAAREMSNRFEERYRMMVASLASHPMADLDSLRGGYHKISTKKAPKARTSVGPRQQVDVLPPVTDTSMQAIVDLHKKMQEMENEIKRLKATVRQNDIRNSLDAQRAAAQEPLTIDEKRALCAQISRLEGDRLAHVVDIIQSALPPDSRSNNSDNEDAELEIPVDELDTFTLRKLQDYVMGASANSATMLQPKKKRGPPPGASPRAPKEPAAKKAKTSGQVGRPSKQKVQQHQAELGGITNISAPAPTSAPTFFSNRTFDSAAAEGSGSDNDDEPHERRGRSDSLDLFVSEMDAEFPSEDAPPASSHLHSLDAWREVNTTPKPEGATSGGSWGEAVFEKLDNDNRKRVEEERKREQQARADLIRQQASNITVPTPVSPSRTTNGDSEAQRLREEERQRLESMQQTVHLDASRESMEQTFYT